MRALLLTALFLTSAVTSAACTTQRDQLARSQTAFDASDLERARLSLRDLEPNVRLLAPADRARYDYLRGMTEYRLGNRAEARHWLGITRANDASALPGEWRVRLDESLKELDTAVFDDGYSSLVTSKK